VKDTRQDATPTELVAASVQLVLPNDPVVGDELKLTDPVGVLAPLEGVSVTIAVHVVALPNVSDVGEQATLVEVGSTAGAGACDVAVTEFDWPLLVLWVPSPW
jgi:hypothetical protein